MFKISLHYEQELLRPLETLKKWRIPTQPNPTQPKTPFYPNKEAIDLMELLNPKNVYKVITYNSLGIVDDYTWKPKP